MRCIVLSYIKSHKVFTFILVIVAMVCLLIPVHYLKVFADEKQANGSTIGGVAVSGLNDREIKDVLEKRINEWRSEPVMISGGGEEIRIDSQDIQFDIESSIKNYRNLVDQPFYLFWKSEKVVHIPIHIKENADLKEQISYITSWDSEETYQRVITQASYLKSHEVEAKVTDFTQLENERIGLTIEQIPENAKGVKALVEGLDGYVLQPNETFSFLSVLENLSDSANTEGLNFVGSMIYNTVLQGNVDILERHPQNELPNYLQPGLNVFVDAFSEKDFQFVNVSKYPYLLKLTVEGEKLKVELFSSIKEMTVELSVAQESIAPRIINRYSKKLPMGTSKLIQEGKAGLRVTVTRIVTMDNDEQKVEEVSRDYYAPTNRIVLNSSIQPETSIEDEESTSNSKNIENLDLNGDGLPDYDHSNDSHDENVYNDDDDLPPGSYYDKGGNLVTS